VRFPDGVLYVDLEGASPDGKPLAPPVVLAALLRELGAPRTGEVISSARAYRARLRGRRMLVVLDNATNASQVLPAIPDEPGCAAIVTSRRPIPGPDGTVHMHIDTLTPAEAVALLARIVGPRKADAEPDATARLAELCGHLPLALREVATRAATRPHWPLSSWVELLDDESHRLDELPEVRASLSVSVRQLTDDAAELFRLLGTLAERHVTPAIAAELTGLPAPAATAALEHLVDAQLLYSPGPGRYAYYGLVSLLPRTT